MATLIYNIAAVTVATMQI